MKDALVRQGRCSPAKGATVPAGAGSSSGKAEPIDGAAGRGARAGDGGLRQVVLVIAACLVAGATAMPAARAAQRAASPVVLTPRELDTITAADHTVRVETMAMALGQTAFTSAQDSVQSERASILNIDVDPHRPFPAQVRLLGSIPVELFYAQGRAAASGQTAVSASVNIVLSGNFEYVGQARQTTTTPTSVTQTAAVFAIALLP